MVSIPRGNRAHIPSPWSPSSSQASCLLVGLRRKKERGWVAFLVAVGGRAGSLV